MAALAKPSYQGAPSLSSLLPPSTTKISVDYVGEDIGICDACYIKTDGKVWKSNGTTNNAAAKVRGYAASPAKAGQRDAITLFHGVEIGWPNALPPGTDLYLSATIPGGLDTVAPFTGAAAVAFTISVDRVFVYRSNY